MRPSARTPEAGERERGKCRDEDDFEGQRVKPLPRGDLPQQAESPASASGPATSVTMARAVPGTQGRKVPAQGLSAAGRWLPASATSSAQSPTRAQGPLGSAMIPRRTGESARRPPARRSKRHGTAAARIFCHTRIACGCRHISPALITQCGGCSPHGLRTSRFYRLSPRAARQTASWPRSAFGVPAADAQSVRRGTRCLRWLRRRTDRFGTMHRHDKHGQGGDVRQAVRHAAERHPG